MGRLNKKILISAAMMSLLTSSALASIPSATYDMRPKNHDRGGSRGKGGKIKYARR